MKIINDESIKAQGGKPELDKFYEDLDKKLTSACASIKGERFEDRVLASLTTRISLLRKGNPLPDYSGLA